MKNKFRHIKYLQSYNNLLNTFSTAIEESVNIIFITDVNGYFEYVNKKFTEITGYKLEELKEKTPRILKSGKQSEYFYNNLWETIISGKTWRGEIINKSKKGDLFWENTTIFPLKDENGIITNFLAEKEIITKEVKTKEALIQSKENFKNIFDFAEDTIIVHDFSGNMLEVNKSFYERLGYTYDEAMKLNPEDFDLNESSEKLEERIKEIREKGFSVFETIAISKDGKRLYTEVNTKVVDFNGKKALLSIGRDITKRVNLISELKKAKEEAESAGNMKAAFLANMSHEIRTPMNGILGFTDLLKKPDLPEEKKQNYIEIISKSGNHLLNLINDIIDISKIDAGHVSIFEEECKVNFCMLDLHKFFQGVAYEKSNGKVKLIINYGIPVGEDTIITDKTKVNQILTNLIGNAIKFTNKGSVTISSTIYEEKFILFSVKDTGIGLTKDEIKIIFERFRQADYSTTKKFGGTGLGLAISKAYTEMLGGKIWVESKKGKGATFYFTIPYKKVPEK
ncbi:MAG: PAS domain S-box protein [Bacteroidales bacterium]|nr:PAS domain S-box protein [Bacteroidales bacterium]